jgi:hypothetical protein
MAGYADPCENPRDGLDLRQNRRFQTSAGQFSRTDNDNKIFRRDP